MESVMMLLIPAKVEYESVWVSVSDSGKTSVDNVAVAPANDDALVVSPVALISMPAANV
jgi:hypothetical protein